jgi:3-isopropylmalate dehydrogenase
LKKKQLMGVDFVIYRELSGGIYYGEKNISENGDSASDMCTYSRAAIERIARKAFVAALQRKKKLTLVDKSNILATSRLWRKTTEDIATDYPDVNVDYLYVDNASMQLIMNPVQFDVILTENLFGDILSDEASVICGSLGLLPSASFGDSHALFEPIHGSYPKAAGKDLANPVGSILSIGMMLDYFGLKEEASEIREAVGWTLNNGFVSQDIDPVNAHYTSTIGEFVSDFISNDIPENINARNIAFGKATII